MIRVLVLSAFVVCALLGCKSSKNASTYIGPHTDTIKVVVNYQPDTVELYVKRIIKSDSLFNLKGAADYSLIGAEQKDSILYLTMRSHNGCTKMDFDLYQSGFVFKSYPPRIRMRLAKTSQKKCGGENEGRVNMFTAAFDIRDILNEYKQANVMFKDSRTVANLKK